MPEMNCVAFLEAVRETHPELPVLLFSGEETNEVAAEVIQAGLTDYLRKGLDADRYTMLIRRVEHGGEWSGRSVGLRSDGSTFTESKVVTALDDGRLPIAVS